jgi:hypothetical protein
MLNPNFIYAEALTVLAFFVVLTLIVVAHG